MSGRRPEAKHLYMVELEHDPEPQITITNPKTGHKVMGTSNQKPQNVVVAKSIRVEGKVVTTLSTSPDTGFTIKEKRKWFSNDKEVSFVYYGTKAFAEKMKFKWHRSGNVYSLKQRGSSDVWASYVPKGFNGGELRTFITIESVSHCIDASAWKLKGQDPFFAELLRLMIISIVPIMNEGIRKQREKAIEDEKRFKRNEKRWKF
jgi:hypothetical protein